MFYGKLTADAPGSGEVVAVPLETSVLAEVEAGAGSLYELRFSRRQRVGPKDGEKGDDGDVERDGTHFEGFWAGSMGDDDLELIKSLGKLDERLSEKLDGPEIDRSLCDD